MLLDKIKLNLRIKNDKFDLEINDLIEAAKLDLKISGVNKIIDTDPLIQQAVKIYCKANFGDNKENERYLKSYQLIKEHLALSGDYK